MDDRRRYPRFKFYHRVLFNDSCQIIDKNTGDKCQTEDVSRGGVRIKSKRKFNKGKVLNLRIYNPSYKAPVDADAKVVWSEGEDGEPATTGLCFTRIGWIESDKLFKPDVS